MKNYVLMNEQRTVIKIGKSNEICEFLSVTRQAISKATKNSGMIKGYLIESYPIQKNIKKSKSYFYSKSLELLKMARVIIDESNKEYISKGEYANINIIRRIDNLFADIELQRKLV